MIPPSSVGVYILKAGMQRFFFNEPLYSGIGIHVHAQDSGCCPSLDTFYFFGHFIAFDFI